MTALGCRQEITWQIRNGEGWTGGWGWWGAITGMSALLISLRFQNGPTSRTISKVRQIIDWDDYEKLNRIRSQHTQTIPIKSHPNGRNDENRKKRTWQMSFAIRFDEALLVRARVWVVLVVGRWAKMVPLKSPHNDGNKYIFGTDCRFGELQR